MKIITLSAQCQNGKNLASAYLVKRLNELYPNNPFSEEAFAFNVKRIYAETFDVSYEFIEEWKSKPEPPPGFDLPVRKGLQLIGDGFRKIKDSIWIDLVFRTQNNKVICDGRYINELKRTKKENGINILIVRPGYINDDPNASEAEIKPYAVWALENLKSGVVTRATLSLPDFNNLIDIYLCNDGTIEEFHQQIEKMIPFIVGKLEL
jgi:hypothetical protein